MLDLTCLVLQYVHVECLQRWRRESESAFFRCPQCSYQYRTDRTKVAGLASNPGQRCFGYLTFRVSQSSLAIIAALSMLLFTCLSYIASFVATFVVSSLDIDEPPPATSSFSFYVGYGWDFVNPIEAFYNFMRLVARVLRDGDLLEVEKPRYGSGATSRLSRGLLGNVIRRVIIGVPVIGIASVIQVLLQLHLLGPVNMLARHRGRNRRETSRDLAMLLILGAIILGIFRFVFSSW